MPKRLTIRELRDLICNNHGEHEYVDALLERLESKESKNVFKRPIRIAQDLVDSLIEAEEELRKLEDKNQPTCDDNCYQKNESGDTSAFELTIPDRYLKDPQNHESV